MRNPKIPTKWTLVALSTILVGSLLAWNKAKADEGYWYTSFSVGHFLDGDYDMSNPDGKLPAWIAFGYEKEWGNWEAHAEVVHRSNVDLGWPVGPAGESEYSRNGVKAGIKYKFK